MLESETLEHLVCPRCRDQLERGPTLPDGSGLLVCACSAAYPVLAGVPVLVRDPAVYLRRFRDPVLATLAERGLANRSLVDLVQTFVEASPAVEPESFGDDWVRDEETWPQPPQGAPPALAELVEAARGAPERAVLELLGQGHAVVVDMACGAGLLTRALRERFGTVLAADLSLRAVFRAGLPGVVCEAEAMPFAPVDALVAANLVDLLDEPEDFLQDCLELSEVTVLTSPAPELLAGAEQTREAVPWMRAHGPNEWQLYLLRVARL